MRVLDPAVRNPIYKLHDKATKSIGDGGTLATIGVVGIGVPVTTGVLWNDLLVLASMVGWYGLATFYSYKKNTKTRSRITMMANLREQIPADYVSAITPLMKEVYDCPNNHYDFRTSDTRGVKYRHISHITGGFSNDFIQFKETEAEFKQRQADEAILKIGYGCKYCGERLKAAQDLRDECATRAVENNSALEHARAVIESKREANKAMKQFGPIYTEAQRELM